MCGAVVPPVAAAAALAAVPVTPGVTNSTAIAAAAAAAAGGGTSCSGCTMGGAPAWIGWGGGMQQLINQRVEAALLQELWHVRQQLNGPNLQPSSLAWHMQH